MNKDIINEFASFDEYLRQGEPSQKESAENWKTAIGLQAVKAISSIVGIKTNFLPRCPITIPNVDCREW